MQLYRKKKGTYSNKVDVWSYGILLFFMGFGE